MFDPHVQRLLTAYPAIFVACHRRHLREDSSGKTVTEHQASVLDHLHPTRPTTLNKLAEHMGVGRSAMSISVARLMRHGYIRSRRDPQDSRRVALTLTRSGERVKEENTVLDPELVRELLRPMPAAEREIALRGMETLANYASALLRRKRRERDQ